MNDHPLERWHCAVVHAPQRGRQMSVMTLAAAFEVVFDSTFRRVREIVGYRDAMLEFGTQRAVMFRAGSHG